MHRDTFTFRDQWSDINNVEIQQGDLTHSDYTWHLTHRVCQHGGTRTVNGALWDNRCEKEAGMGVGQMTLGRCKGPSS